MIWSLRRFRRAVAALLDEIPPRLLEGLTGGVLVMPEARRRPEDPPGIYLLGEYHVDPGLGRLIVIYYGSFRQIMIGATWERVVKELRHTIRHELRHHVEHLAGLADLEVEDRIQLEGWRTEEGFPTSPQRRSDSHDGGDPRGHDYRRQR